MRNTLQVNSISVEVHWHMLQMAVSEEQLPPSNTNVYSVHKRKMQDDIKWETISNQEFIEHQVLFTNWMRSTVIAELNLIPFMQ